MSFLRSLLLWLSAIILVLIPMGLAADFGGVLHWSQYVAGLGVVLAACLSLVGFADSTASSGLRQHKLLIPLGMLVALAWIQTWSLPPSLVGLLSPGSRSAYTTWLDGLLPAAEQPQSISVSVSPDDTHHATLLLTMLLPLAFAGSIVFHARNRLTMLLSAIALTGASVALFGFYRKLDPTADIWFFDSKANAFAGFVNRNNAALMLNLGLGASLGLLSWRMMALHNIELDDPDFEFNDLFALISDRESLIGLLSAVTCVAGLLINGSRGGVVAALFGLIFAFGYVRPRRGKLSLPVMAVVLAVSVAILTVPMRLNLETISRLELLSADADTLQKDGRMLHWQDGWDAAIAHLPMGSGVGTYAYSYLPYQSKSPGSWFEHADNLWLEMLVETGLAGVAIATILFSILLISLRRLSMSADPIDQGIRVAAWYSIAAVAVSQLFDFGLILPANLFVAVLLGVAVVSRQVASGGMQTLPIEEEEDPYHAMAMADPEFALTEAESRAIEEDRVAQQTPPSESSLPKIALKSNSLWGRWTSTGASACLAAVVLLVACVALPGLQADASSESLTRRIEREYDGMKFEPEILEQVETRLAESLTENPSPSTRQWLAATQRDRGRLAETLEWRPSTLDQAAQIYAKTNLDDREIDYPPPLAAMTRGELDSAIHYAASWDTSMAGLVSCPLSQAMRAGLVQIQSVRETQPATSVAIKHLASFYSTEPRRLFRLGTRAFAIRDDAAAAKTFRQSISLNPSLTSGLMKIVRDHRERLPLADVIPDLSKAVELAAADVLRWDQPDEVFLRRATEEIRCGENSDLTSRSRCQALLSEIHFQLAQPEEGIKAAEQAIRMKPDNALYRVRLIENLLDNGDRPAALQQARIGRQVLPDDARFQGFVDRIAEAEREQILEPVLPTNGDGPSVESILK